MADREAGQVRSGGETRHAKRRGGELQIKPEDREAGDKLIAYRRLQTKTAGGQGQSVCNKASHVIIPVANLRQSGAARQGFLKGAHAPWRAGNGQSWTPVLLG